MTRAADVEMSRDHLARQKQTLCYRSQSDKEREWAREERRTAWTGCGEQRARAIDLRRCSTLELVPGQGQHPRVGVSLNVTRSGIWLGSHPIQTPRDRESSRQRKAETQWEDRQRTQRDKMGGERDREHMGQSCKERNIEMCHRPMA